MKSIPRNPNVAPPGWEYKPEVIREFVRRCRWQWASTMIDIPHEYIYNGRCALSPSEYWYFLQCQLYAGEMEWYGKNAKPYLYLDGYKYWTMGGLVPENKTMNRQRVFDEIDRIGAIPQPYYTDLEARTVAKIISEQNPVSMFEFGVGDGRWLEYTMVPPANYRCCDPSRMVSELFKGKNPQYASRFVKKTFEESVNRWGAFTFICGLFGSASYIMWQYLQLFAERGIPYLLMFFKTNERPQELRDYHCFNYTEYQLRQLFPRGIFSDWGGYKVVSSFPIDWALKEGLAREESSYSPSLF